MSGPPLLEVVADLEAEEDCLDAFLSAITAEQWSLPSAAPGWTVRDVVVHLAQTEEAVTMSLEYGDRFGVWDRGERPLDDAVDEAVRSERAPSTEVFERWRAARRAALDALRTADPDRRVPWAAAPLRPVVLATTRLAEHWAHALDIATAVGVDVPDTARLRHIAWLGHRTLPYAFGLDGLEPRDVYCELAGPDGESWRFGPADAESTISGSAGEFCRVGARRLSPEQTSLVPTGPHAAAALRVLRNYAA